MAAHYQILWGAAPFLHLWPPLPLASLCSSHSDLPYGSRACQSGSHWRGFCLVFPQPGFFFPSLVFRLSVYRSPPQGSPSWLLHLREPTEHCPIPLHLFYPCLLGFISVSVICLFLFCSRGLVLTESSPSTYSHFLRGHLAQAALWPDQLQQPPNRLSIRYKWRWVWSLKMIPTIGSFRPDLDFISYARIRPPSPHLFLLNSIAVNTRGKQRKKKERPSSHKDLCLAFKISSLRTVRVTTSVNLSWYSWERWSWKQRELMRQFRKREI